MADYRRQMLGWIGNKAMETLCKLVSEGEFPVGEEIDLAIRNKSQMTDLENKAKSSEMCKLLVEKKPDSDFWTLELLEAIDHAAKTNLEAVAPMMGMPEDAYLSQLSKYTRDVITLLEAHHKEHPLLPKVIARFKWVMNDRHAKITPLPLMTDFVFVSLVSSLSRISNAINAVSAVSYRCSDAGFYCSNGSILIFLCRFVISLNHLSTTRSTPGGIANGMILLQ
jgi:hypothetical protein